MKCSYCKQSTVSKKPLYLCLDKVFYICCRICYGIHKGYSQTHMTPFEYNVLIPLENKFKNNNIQKTEYIVCYKCKKLLDLTEKKCKIPEKQIFCETCY